MGSLDRRSRSSWRLRALLVMAVVLLLAGVAGLIRVVRHSFGHACVVCVTHEGREVCREAVGATQDAAVRRSLVRACDYLTVTGADRAECIASARIRVECSEPGEPGSGVLAEPVEGRGQ